MNFENRYRASFITLSFITVFLVDTQIIYFKSNSYCFLGEPEAAYDLKIDQVSSESIFISWTPGFDGGYKVHN